MCTETKRCMVHMLSEKYDEIETMFFNEYGKDIEAMGQDLDKNIKSDIAGTLKRLQMASIAMDAKRGVDFSERTLAMNVNGVETTFKTLEEMLETVSGIVVEAEKVMDSGLH